MHSVESLGFATGQVGHARSHHLQTRTFETGVDLADHVLGDGIWFDDGEGALLGHDFAPAYYGLLTGDIAISPRNEDVIKRERALDNANGMKMKIIIGSQIASEGVDLRFIREIHVLDSWFHLNKTEQILSVVS